MKYTINGFSQRAAIDLGLSNDNLLILRWFIDFKDSGSMDRKYINEINNMGFWVRYDKIINDLPILFSGKSIDANKKKFQRILGGSLSKVMKRDTTKLAKGTKIYLYLVEDTYNTLISDSTSNSKHKTKLSTDDLQDKYVHLALDNNVQSTQDKSVQSDTTINNNSIIDISTTQKQSVVVDTNKELIESNTNIKLSNNMLNKVKQWNKDRLLLAIDIFNNISGEYFSLLEKIYKDDNNFVEKKKAPLNGSQPFKSASTSKTKNCNNSIPQNNSSYNVKPNRFNNGCNNSAIFKYTPEELEKLLQENSKRKFG